ncbi:MAG: ABC transporter ATP-binding protein [Alicyclobacillus sp.]|nr:ABC transporter ATP-binding protein [Alicyclobacillus sp.]
MERQSGIVEIRNLSIEFRLRQGTICALDNVNFSVPKGKVTALVGESGSGKSTLAAAILNLVSAPGKITRGEVVYNGINILNWNERELQRYRWSEVSMVFQAAQNSLNPVMRIEESIVETVLSHRKMSRQEILRRALDLFEMVRLEPRRVLKAYPHELSGGMKQRVMIAFSLLLDPQLVILDEPTTALDVITQDYIFEILLRVHRELGITMLLLSHDIAVVAKLADYVGVMYAGRVVEYGEVLEVLQSPKHPYTKGLIQAAPSLIGDPNSMRPIQGSPPNLLQLPTGCAFHPRCPLAMEICKESIPQLIDVAGGHLSACFLSERVTQGQAAAWTEAGMRSKGGQMA